MPGSDQLIGKSYLIVEDEYLTASSLVMLLEDAGAVVIGPISGVPDALELISKQQQAFDGAVLDINLRGSMVYPVAEKLEEARIPFVFVTGYDCDTMPSDFRKKPCLSKPCDEQELLAIMATFPSRGSSLQSHAAVGTAGPPT